MIVTTYYYRIHIIREMWIGFKNNYVSRAEVAHELLLQNMFLQLLNLFRVLVAMKMLATYLKRSEIRYACTVA